MFRLHEIERAMELFSSDGYPIRPVDLYNMSEKERALLENHNIYIVGRRPRVSIDPSGLTLDRRAQRISGRFVIRLQDREERIPFVFRHVVVFSMAAVGVSAQGHGGLHCLCDGTRPLFIPVEQLMFGVEKTHELRALADVTVEYIGRAFGESGERDAVDRLIGTNGKNGHGALQRVLAEISAEPSNEEVLLVLFSFEFCKKMAGAGGLGEPVNAFDSRRLWELPGLNISRKNRIDLVEASLIRYFQPRLNTKFKANFPDVSQKILSELLDNDVTGIAVTASTEDSNIRLRSACARPASKHMALINIRTQSDRMSFFDIGLPLKDDGYEPLIDCAFRTSG